MSEEEKAIERCKELIKPEHSHWIGISNQKAIETVLNLVDKQNKVIDEMIQEDEYNARINVKDFCEECQRKDKCIQDCHTHIKQYFIRKVKEDDNSTSK